MCCVFASRPVGGDALPIFRIKHKAVDLMGNLYIKELPIYWMGSCGGTVGSWGFRLLKMVGSGLIK